MEKDLEQNQLQLNLIYLIVNFLVIPFKEEYSKKMESILKESSDTLSNDLLSSIKSTCEKNINSLKNFFKLGTKSDYDNNVISMEFRYYGIKKFLGMVENIDFYHKDIHEVLNDIISNKIDNENKNILLSTIGSYYYSAIEEAKKYKEKSIEILCIILRDIYFFYKNSEETLKINLKAKELESKLSQNQKTVNDLTKKLEAILKQTDDVKESLKNDIVKMEEDVKKNTPIVQLSTFGIFITLIINSVGIFQVSDISFKMLSENKSFCSALALLVVTTLCILAFVFVMQRILFYALDKKPLSFTDMFNKDKKGHIK